MRRLRTQSVTLLLLLLAAASAQAQLTAQISANVVGVGEVFQLTITAEGGTVSPPVLPDSADFVYMNVQNPGVSTGISTTIVNGMTSMRRTRSYTYGVRVDKEGTFTLPPIRVQIDGKDYATEPLSVTVTKDPPRRQRARRSPFGGIDPFSIMDEQRERAAQRQRGSSQRDEIPMEKAVLLEAKAEKSEVFQGEGLTVLLSYAYVISGVSARADAPKIGPVQGCFVSDAELMPDTRMEQDGLTYNRRTMRYIVYPMTSGEFTIPRVEWPVQISTSFNLDARVVVKKTEPIPFTVKPLPPAPPGFSGTVGEIKVTAELPSGELLQGTPVDFVFAVTGSANASSVTAPELPRLAWAHLSPPSVNPDEAAQRGALKVFRYALTPLEPGAHEMPALRYTYFSPKAGDYVDAVTPAIPVNLRKAVDTGPMVVAGAGTSAPRAALHPILPVAGELGPQGSRLGLVVAVLLLPPLSFAALWMQARRRRRLAEDPAFARAYYARSRSAKLLAGVRDSAEPSEALFRALVGFVADTLGVPESGMTSADARRAVIERGLPPGLAEKVEKILRACERARYAGAALPALELGALLDAAQQAMDEIEDGLKGGASR